MNSKDIFTPKSLIPVGTMIVTTPNAREIVGHGPSAFMDMWLKAVQPPEWEVRVEPPELIGVDIILLHTKLSYGKRIAQTGSMRQKKQRRHAALVQRPYKSTKLTNCHPIMMGMDSAAPGVEDQTVIDLSFNYDAVKMA